MQKSAIWSIVAGALGILGIGAEIIAHKAECDEITIARCEQIWLSQRPDDEEVTNEEEKEA